MSRGGGIKFLPLRQISMRYPLFLDLTGQPVVVVGAGKVATRKTKNLLAAGASVTVIAPVASPALRRLKSVRWLKRRYQPGDLRGARLVVAATDSLDVNRQVCTEAHRRRQLVNCAAPPYAGNFIVPAIVRHGAFTIAISTGGASPAAAKALRQQLERSLGA